PRVWGVPAWRSRWRKRAASRTRRSAPRGERAFRNSFHGGTNCGHLTPRPGETQLFRGDSMYNAAMITVRLPQKKKELEVRGPRRVMDLLADAGGRPTTVNVTQAKKLLPKDHRGADG